MASPTVELEIELRGSDRIIGPFSMFQAVALCVGMALGMGIFYLRAIPVVPRGALALLVPLFVLLGVWVRPRGHTLPRWAFLLLDHMSSVRSAVWTPERLADEPDPAPELALSGLLKRMGVDRTAVRQVALPAATARPPDLPGRPKTQLLTFVPDAINDRMLTMCTTHRCGVIETVGPNLRRLSDQQRAAWNDRLVQLLRGFDYLVKFLERVRPADIESYLLEREARVRQIQNRTLRKLVLHDITYMRSLARRTNGTGLVSDRTFIVVPAPAEVEDYAAHQGFWRTLRGARRPKRRPDSLEAAAALDALCSRLIEHLDGLGVYARRLSEAELADLINGSTKPRSAGLQPLDGGALAGAQIPVAPMTISNRRAPLYLLD